MIHSTNCKTSTYKSEIHSRYFEINKNKGTPFFKAIKKDKPATSLTTKKKGGEDTNQIKVKIGKKYEFIHIYIYK